MAKKQYAPFGIGNPNNKFWVRLGSYEPAFESLSGAKDYARGFPNAALKIRDRSGRVVAERVAPGTPLVDR